MKKTFYEYWILIYVVFVIFLFIAENIILFYLLVIFSILAFILHPNKKFRSGMVPILIVVVSTFIGNLFFQDGKVAFTFYFISVTEQALQRGFTNSTRIFIMIVSAKLLFFNRPSMDIIHAMKNILKIMGVDKIINIDSFFDIMAISITALPIIKEQIIANYKISIKENTRISAVKRIELMLKVGITPLQLVFEKPEEFLKQHNIHNLSCIKEEKAGKYKEGA